MSGSTAESARSAAPRLTRFSRAACTVAAESAPRIMVSGVTGPGYFTVTVTVGEAVLSAMTRSCSLPLVLSLAFRV